MVLWIIGIALALIVGLWLAFSVAGLIIHILGYILLIAAVVGIWKLATRGNTR